MRNEELHFRLTKADFVAYGEGGLCLSCPDCTYPHCPFGK